jgi:hypothetical protein
MGFKDVDIAAALTRLAERRIEEAINAGKFDNLPGMGEPIEIDEAPADEKARELWWALRLLKQNDFVPEEVRWRKTIDGLKASLHNASEESAVRHLCGQINALVHKLNTLGTNAINIAVNGVDVDEELRKRRGG